MNIRELVQAYNTEIQQGKNSEEVAESLGMQRKTLQQKMRRHNYICNADTGLYVLKEGAEIKESRSVEKVRPEVEPKVEPKVKSDAPKIIQKTSKEDLSKVLQQLKELSERVEKLEKNSVSVELASTQEDGTDLILRDFNTPVKQISYRYHEDVLQALDDLCKKYPHYTKHAIINSLLMGAIESVRK